MFIRYNERGDTIVEVLIAIAIVGLVLGTGYVAANRSSTNIEVAQEHQIAVTIVQSQLEQLNAQNLASLSPPIPLPNDANNIACFTPSSTGPVFNNSARTHSPCVDYNSEAEDFTVAITNVTAGGSPSLQTYQVDVNWPRLSGGQDDVKLFYQTAGSND
jgi:prepilin-type N-terminal cleavage/methylation domain-containing protein